MADALSKFSLARARAEVLENGTLASRSHAGINHAGIIA
jgi:hypothetical protein